MRKCTYKYQQDQYPTPIKVYIRHTYSSYVSAQRVNSNINFFLFCYFEKGIVRCFCCFFSFNIMAYICLAREDVRRVTSANERARQCLLFCWFNCILYTRNKLSSFLFFSQKELLSLDKNRAMSLQPDSKNKASRSASAPPGTSGAGSEKLKDKCRLMWIRQKQLQTILHTHLYIGAYDTYYIYYTYLLYFEIYCCYNDIRYRLYTLYIYIEI